MPFDAYGSSRIVSARITLPAWGAAVGDAQLADDAAVPARATLTIGNLALVMTARRGGGAAGAFAGSRGLRLVAGADGWRQTCPRQFYADPLGIKLATVLRDAAVKVGESVALSSAYASRAVGVFWSREEAPASRTLKNTIGNAWWIDALGVTQIGERPTTRITSAFVPTFDPARGQWTIATEDPLSWRPGATFTTPLVTGTHTVSSVSLVLADSKLRLEVLT
jgi:hypothetical protein